MPVRCAFCDEWNVPSANFCGSCGKPAFEMEAEIPRPSQRDSRPPVIVSEPRKKVPAKPWISTAQIKSITSVVSGILERFHVQQNVVRVWTNLPIILFLLGLVSFLLLSFGFPRSSQSVASADDFRGSETIDPMDGKTEFGQPLFPDVSEDHPIYRAWRPILSLGIHLAAPSGEALPCDPISWEAWRKAVTQTFVMFPIPGEAQRFFLTSSRGNLNGRQLSDQLNLLARFWRVAPPASAFKDTSSPDRLEAFAALSRLVTCTRGR